MADQKDDHLSPEEKLLRVIQGGGQKRKPAAAPAGTPADSAATPTLPPRSTGPAASTLAKPAPPAEPPSAPAPTATADRGRLKLAKGGEQSPAAKASADTKAAATAAAGSAEKGGAGAGRAAPAKRAAIPKRVVSDSDLSVRTLNIVLAALILIVLLLTGHEIWANVRPPESVAHAANVSLPEIENQDTNHILPSLEQFRDEVDKRPFFIVPNVQQTPPPVGPGPGPDQTCKLMGISKDVESGEQEVIVQDNDLKGKMLFLKVGDQIQAGGQDWTLREIQADSITFVCGNRVAIVR